MPEPRGQLTLDLGHRPAYGRDDFLVAPGNRDAVDWIDRWPAWPGHALALYGPAGCGKSHLTQVFTLKAAAAVVGANDITVDDVDSLLGRGRALALEEADQIKDSRALLHLFNAAKERGVSLLLTGREAPARWPVTLPDLRSRLAAIPAVGISAPSDEMIEAVLIKLFADRQLTVAPDVIAYVLRRMDRSFAAARQLVARADADSLAGKRAVTVPLVKGILEG
jgi:chromosomal replication initiation ATPase DnaA